MVCKEKQINTTFYLVTDRGAGIIFVSICKEGKASRILRRTFAFAIYILAYVKSALWNYAIHSLHLCKRNEYWLRFEGIRFHCTFCRDILKIFIPRIYSVISFMSENCIESIIRYFPTSCLFQKVNKLSIQFELILKKCKHFLLGILLF